MLEAPFCSQVQDFGLFWRFELGDCLMMFEASSYPDGVLQGFDSTSC